MKKLAVYTIFLFISISISTCLAQNETTMQDIIEQVSIRTKELEKDNKLEIVNVTIDLLVKDAHKSFIRYLDPDFDYTVIAFGDRRIDTLTLTVYRPGYSEIEYVSENTAENPRVHFSILNPEPFEFELNVNKYSGSNITGHFAVIIYHKEE